MNRTLIFRRAVLMAAGNPLIRRAVTKYGMRIGAARFIAGEALDEAVTQVQRLNDLGLTVTLDYLGESVETREQAEDAADMILQTIDAIYASELDSHISVKLTQLGLLFDVELCYGLMRQIVERARDCGTFVRIDMEDSSVTDATLVIHRKLEKQYGSRHVGVVIQSYLYRSEQDIRELGERRSNVRIVKGAYHEPHHVAYPDKKDVDRQYLDLAKEHLLSGSYTAIATHDPSMIQPLLAFIQEHNIPPAQFEFQMLYGIATGLQKQLSDEGFKVRVYTPFGEHWYAYFSRRIAERPANLAFVLKGLLPGRSKL